MMGFLMANIQMTIIMEYWILIKLICFRGEEQSPWDHDNDGILDWADTDWDGDGISNNEQAGGGAHPEAPWDHDNDGLRDDIDPDDDEDGMNDEDEVMLWPVDTDPIRLIHGPR